MGQRFADQVVWITGASGGIGAALALAFSAEGAKLVLSARRGEELERVRARCANPENVVVLPVDLDALPAAAAAVPLAIAAFGRVDVMVHNAGISQRSRVEETALEVDERIMRVNYFAAIAITKALLPHFLARGSGRFVVVSSVVGYIGTPLRSTYAASKHALHGFFDSLRAEVRERGVGVTIVCPGFVRTEISRNALDGAGAQHGMLDEATARGRTPEACARGIVDATARRSDEAYLGGREIATIYLKRWWPWLLARIVERVKTT